MKRTLLILFLVVALSAAGFLGVRSYQQQTQPVVKQPIYQTAAVTRGNLADVVGGSGVVRSNQSISLAWQTTGQVAKVNVKIGDHVADDQVLASLDEESLPQSIIMAQSSLVTARRALDNLRKSAMAQANAQFALAQAQQAVTDRQHDRDLLNYSRGENGNADAAWAAYYISVDAYNKALDRFNKLKNFDITKPADASVQAALVNAQQIMQQKKNIVDWYTGAPTDNDVAQADAKVMIAKAALADAQREWDRLKNGPDPDDITAAQAQVASIEATLNLATLNATFAGTVTDVSAMVGDQIVPGKVSFRVDDLSRLLVDIQVAEEDAYRVQVGQPVKLTFDAIPGKEFNGKVDSVASIGLPMGNTINFKVTVVLIDGADEIRPGITASVNILTDQAVNTLLVENRALRSSQGQTVVYVLRSGALTRVPVTLGISSDTYTEIKSGDLSEGDLVVLNPPAEAK